MAEFLLLLGKVNLAFAAAIILVWLLRRPVRKQFGAGLAYALWLLVPVAGAACLLPPRTEAPVVRIRSVEAPAARNFAAPLPAAAPQAAPFVPERAAKLVASSPASVIAAPESFKPVDYAPLLFAAWIMGAGLMGLYLARLQIQFYAAVRAGRAGPAVVGFWRPRLVSPADFTSQFTFGEQAAILAHEGVHLARQDARINALSALLRALCWFNPLMQLADRWLRIDQELACDAAAMRGGILRRDYARALLKSQITRARLPLGCNWPGSEHPLVERIALLKRKPPGRPQRIGGLGFVVIAAASAGISAWAAQPPVPGKMIVIPAHQLALAAHGPVVPAIVLPVTLPLHAELSPLPSTQVSNPDEPPAKPPIFQPAVQNQQIALALSNASQSALAIAAANASSALPNKSVAEQLAAIATMPATDPPKIAAATSEPQTSQPLQVPPDQHLAFVSVQTNFVPGGNVRPEVAQPLEQAVKLAKAVDRNPPAIIASFNQAAGMPDLNRDETNAINRAGAILFGASLASRARLSPFEGSFWWSMRPSIPVSSYLPAGDVGPNNPN